MPAVLVTRSYSSPGRCSGKWGDYPGRPVLCSHVGHPLPGPAARSGVPSKGISRSRRQAANRGPHKTHGSAASPAGRETLHHEAVSPHPTAGWTLVVHRLPPHPRAGTREDMRVPSEAAPGAIRFTRTEDRWGNSWPLRSCADGFARAVRRTRIPPHTLYLTGRRRPLVDPPIRCGGNQEPHVVVSPISRRRRLARGEPPSPPEQGRGDCGDTSDDAANTIYRQRHQRDLGGERRHPAGPSDRPLLS